MAKILSDGLQSSQYAFIVLYICAYHRNKINWFINLIEITISLNYQFASYRLVYQDHPSSYLMFLCYKKRFSKCDEGVIPLLLLAIFHNFIYYGRRFLFFS